MAQFSLSTLYRTAFSVPYTGLKMDTPINKADEYGSVEYGDAQAEATGIFGVPIHMPVELDGYRLPNEPLVTINGQKNIVSTAIDGQDGTFKELYSNGDYVVNIQGIAIDDNNPDEYPEDIMRRIRNIVEKRTHIAVKNRMTGLFSIEYVAIISCNFPATQGDMSMPAYELQCLSDKEFPLRLRTR